MKRTIFHAVIVVFVGLAGFAAGSWFAVRKRSAALLAAYPATGIATPPAAAPPVVDSEGDSEARLLGALRIKNRLERSARLYESIGSIGPAQLHALLQRADQFPADLRDTLRRALFARWLQIDPSGAAKWVRPFVCKRWTTTKADIYGDNLPAQLTEMWATANPAAALAEFTKLPLSVGGAELIAETALKMTVGDHAACLAELGKIADTPKREFALKAALSEWAVAEPAAAFSRLALIHDPALWAEAASDVLGSWVKKDAAAGLAQVDVLLPGLSPEDARLIIGNAAKSGGKNAAGWALAFPEPVRGTAARAVFNAWRDTQSIGEQIAAVEWAGRENILTDPEDAGQGMGYRLQKETLDAILRTPVGAVRTELISQLLHDLPLDDARRAMDAVEPAGRRGLLLTFISGQALSAPTAAKLVETIALVPAGPDAARAATIVGQLLPQRFSAETESAIETVTDPVLRDRMYSAAIRSLDRNSPERTEATLARITDPTQRDIARARLIRGAAHESPAKARAMLESSPLSAEWKEVIRMEWAEQ